ncbi:MAG: alpha-L-rhamnosidase C-terminal domain-containing protein [bacterium]
MTKSHSATLLATVQSPLSAHSTSNLFLADFGDAVFGNVRIECLNGSLPSSLTIRFGEKLAPDGRIDRNPGGNINFREVISKIPPGMPSFEPVIPPKEFHLRDEPVKMPTTLGEVTPFRYIEVEAEGLHADALAVSRVFFHAPFNDHAADFACSDEGLNAVWELCKHTLKATTAFGVYIDGERERIPYEADAYINMMSHFACDLDPQVARATVAHLLAHPTWPTEWSHHMPMIAAMDYLYTGETWLAARHFEALKSKLLLEKARADGLLVASAIVDWPAVERDNYNQGMTDPDNPKQVGPMVNTVANAFYYHALGRMACLADALGRKNEASDLRKTAAKVHGAFQKVFFDQAQGLFTDGEGSDHASQHANFFPLAFGLVPESHIAHVADFIAAKGMACSVYGAQYLLEALFASGRENDAIALMAARGPRTWLRMVEEGSTMTWEAWGPEFKPNLTWNHAWGAAPANILSRFVLGVRPLEPGFLKFLVSPRLGPLTWIRGKVPTPHGSITLTVETPESLHLTVPSSCTAILDLSTLGETGWRVNGKTTIHPVPTNAHVITLQAGVYEILSEKCQRCVENRLPTR